MKHKHARRNTQEYLEELQQLDSNSLSPAHKILGLSKNEDEIPKKPKGEKQEEEKVRETMSNLATNKQTTAGMNSRIYSIPSADKMQRSKLAQKTGQVPSSINIYGSHYPVLRVMPDNKTILVHTSPYGNEGKTEELLEKMALQMPEHFPDAHVIEIHHPDYRHSAKIMRMRNPNSIAEYLKHASENHPDENYRQHAAEAYEHLTKIKKAEYTKPIHAKRTEGEGFDYEKNLQNRLGRLHKYLTSIGLTPDLSESTGRDLGAKHPTSLTINLEGDPHDQQVLHEAAHAMLTPVGQSLRGYQDSIGEPGFKGKIKQTQNKKTLQPIHGGGMPEQTAQHMEAGIARRSGIEPFRSPKRGKERSQEELARQHAKKTLGLMDEGIETFDPFTGEKQHGDSVDALINARARGDKSLVTPIQQKVHSRLKQSKDFDAEEFLAASEKEYFGLGSSLKKAAFFSANLKKALTAGMPVGAPSTMTGGEALQKESLSDSLEQLSVPNKVQKKKKSKNRTLKGIKKGERGDWKKEGYSISHIDLPEMFKQRGIKGHEVVAHDKEGNLVGWARIKTGRIKSQAFDTYVNKDHRRKGLASAMYRYHENKTGTKMHPSKDRTDDGKALWKLGQKKMGEKVFGKSELYEDWFFIDDFGMEKAEMPEKEGVFHPEFKTWVTKRHPNGRMMYHHTPERARVVDEAISNKKAHQKIMSSLPKTHHQAYANMVKQVVTDPNRHFVPTEENGKQKIRARHLNELLSGSDSVKLDTSDPDHLTVHRKSHSKGTNIGKTISIKIPTKEKV
jgi:hypothetical protein